MYTSVVCVLNIYDFLCISTLLLSWFRYCRGYGAIDSSLTTSECTIPTETIQHLHTFVVCVSNIYDFLYTSTLLLLWFCYCRGFGATNSSLTTSESTIPAEISQDLDTSVVPH